MVRAARADPRTATRTTELDPARYKAVQQRAWDAAAAGWRRRGELMERALGPVGERLVSLAGISEGHRVLDVATGIGEPALTAARRVGPTGQVIATDISPGMVAIARERARDAALDNVAFRTVDAEELDLPDASFEAAVCRFGLMLFPDVPGVLTRVRRALAPGGGFAAAVWGPPDRVPLLSVPLRAVMRELSVSPPPPEVPGLFALADGRRLPRVMEQAGFGDVRAEAATVALDFHSAEQCAELMRDTAGAVTEMVRDEPPERQERAWAAVTQVLLQRAATDGRIRLTGEAILVAGRRPARATR